MRVEAINDYKELLRECFETDPDLIEKWHVVSGQGLDACVEKTCKDLKICAAQVFKLADEDESLGYFGKELSGSAQFLTGFFLKPKHRSKRLEFWGTIVDEFGEPFYCGLYAKNLPAINFVKSRGATLVSAFETADGNALLFRIGD